LQEPLPAKIKISADKAHKTSTMARRRTKKRTHVGARNGPSSNNAAMDRSPKSMVVRMGAGEVGPSVSQLVRDVRAMMEPGTAARLKVDGTFSI
jgi:hypothetical protein